MEQSRHGQGITSVKVHHPSGGASSFSLSHDQEADDRFGNSGKIGQAPKQQPQQPAQGYGQQQQYQQQPPQQQTMARAHADNNIFGGAQEEYKQPVQQQQQYQQQQQQPAYQQQQQQQQQSPWGSEPQQQAPSAGPGSFTSVKYSGNPPGGKSSFSLG